MSKRSLKPVYKLSSDGIHILRYICDSIDLNYKRRKVFNTKLHQKQIAIYCRLSLATTKRQIKVLRQKRFLVFVKNKCTYSVGKVLTAWLSLSYTQEVAHAELPVRSSSGRAISNSSYSTNKSAVSTNLKKRQEKIKEQPREYRDINRSDPAKVSEIIQNIRKKNGLRSKI
jgi:hypothetical protein